MEAFEMKVWRRMEKISWTEHISNEVLKLVEEERSLLTIIIIIIIIIFMFQISVCQTAP